MTKYLICECDSVSASGGRWASGFLAVCVWSCDMASIFSISSDYSESSASRTPPRVRTHGPTSHFDLLKLKL